MPQTLKDATKDLIAEKIDKQTWIDRTRPSRLPPHAQAAPRRRRPPPRHVPR
ncbi:hypothetical protein [Streptomyces sp. ALI-76-A]|uniref:hypothetical protein n=1 Tax=Streptomyces sp. ALI-76-A TaxID=3025736 RepID=UPI00256EE9E1|nr:hypothetical protein [Streptomyces sp. ALI-76-A]MDL5202665.1 hypothetical protein [Streptomyces sp. ALI-76-A]